MFFQENFRFISNIWLVRGQSIPDSGLEPASAGVTHLYYISMYECVRDMLHHSYTTINGYPIGCGYFEKSETLH